MMRNNEKYKHFLYALAALLARDGVVRHVAEDLVRHGAEEAVAVRGHLEDLEAQLLELGPEALVLHLIRLFGIQTLTTIIIIRT